MDAWESKLPADFCWILGASFERGGGIELNYYQIST